MLVEVARRLQAETTARDFVARVGGDEFVVLLPGPAGFGRLRFVGNTILAALSRSIVTGAVTGGADCIVTASIGIATSAEGEETDPVAILARADEGVYAAKRSGRGRVKLVAAPAAPAAQMRIEKLSCRPALRMPPGTPA